VVNEVDDPHDSVGSWAKRYYFANRAAIETVLRPFDLGSTQWSVLYQLAHDGPTLQRDLGRLLHLERATLSGVVTTLVRKGLIGQTPGSDDQRQRHLQLTPAGAALWERLPDPMAIVRQIALEGVDPADVEVAIRVMKAATERVTAHTASAQLPR